MVLEIKQVDIQNFRSIEDLTLTFRNNCRILVGINEAGKSNILKALRLLSPDFTVNNYDLRQFGVDDDYSESAFIKFLLGIPDDIVKSFLEEYNNKFLSQKKDILLGKYFSKDILLSDIVEYLDHGYYYIDIKTKKNSVRYSSLSSLLRINKNIKKVKVNCPTNIEVILKNKQTYTLNNYVFLNIEDVAGELPEEYLEDVSIDDLNNEYNSKIITYIKENLPKVIYWKYEDKYLLPARISKSQFTANPNICLPLKNMFELAGFMDISKTFADAEKTSRGTKNMLTKVAQNATQHFRKAWREYKNVEFELLENGEYIEPSIKELNSYEMEQRSDGFKRFVTFLLMVSISVETSKLTNSLIIVDEPEISLHPSGIRFLRDELLKIAKNNYVIYSTHSPFMIDKDDISRHYRVIKENEKTKIIETTQSDYTEEEVLLNALGTTLFEGLRENNVIFEGWRDKKLFSVAITKFPAKYKDIKELYRNIGTAHSKGVKDMKNIVPLIELANKNCLIISDSDKPAQDSQKIFNERRYYGVWKRYDEIFNDKTIITSEDFIVDSAFVKPLKRIAEQYNIGEFDITILDKCNCGKIASFTKWLKDSNIDPANITTILNGIKEQIFNDLKISQIDESYYDFLVNLANILE